MSRAQVFNAPIKAVPNRAFWATRWVFGGVIPASSIGELQPFLGPSCAESGRRLPFRQLAPIFAFTICLHRSGHRLHVSRHNRSQSAMSHEYGPELEEKDKRKDKRVAL